MESELFKIGLVFYHWVEEEGRTFKTEVIGVNRSQDQVFLRDIDQASPDLGVEWTESISGLTQNTKHNWTQD